MEYLDEMSVRVLKFRVMIEPLYQVSDLFECMYRKLVSEDKSKAYPILNQSSNRWPDEENATILSCPMPPTTESEMVSSKI